MNMSVARMVFVIVLGAIVGRVAGAEPAKVSVKYRSIDEASLAALMMSNPDIGPINRAATLELMAQPQRCRRIDLNGDGRDDAVVRNGYWVQADGFVTSLDGATGNGSWVVLAAEPFGMFRIIASGFGTGPGVSNTTHHGWRDLRSGSNFGGPVGVQMLHRYEGDRYACQWSIKAAGLGDPYMVPDATPIEASLVRRLIDLPEGPIDYRSAGCFTGDIDDDGEADMLLQIDQVRIGDKTIDVRQVRPGQPNFFYLVRRGGAWLLVFSAVNEGPIYMPQVGRDHIELSVQREPNHDEWDNLHYFQFSRGARVHTGR
jgi:hypothetical protein